MTIAKLAPSPRRSERKVSLISSMILNVRIIGALMMRDGTMRYGHENLGFFWVMGEPLLLTVGVMGMWTITNQSHGHSIGIVPFALSGYTILTLWRHMTGRAVRVLRSNAGLLFHRNVQLLDILIARWILEMVGILTAFFIAYVPLALVGVIAPINDILIMLVAFVLHGWFSFAVSLVIAGLSEISELVEQFVPPFLYLTLPFTGIFYMVAWLPQEFRDIVVYSPLVNTQEMFRYGMFPGPQTIYWSIPYALIWCIVMTAMGIPLVLNARKHVTLQ